MAGPNLADDLVTACSNVTLDDEEARGLVFSNGTNVSQPRVQKAWSLVGRILTDNPINFPVMQQLFASVWKPVKGVRIRDLGPNLFWFQFFNEKEIDRIYDKGPWSFEQNLLIITKVEEGSNLRDVPLFSTDMWIQVHNVPRGLMSEKVGVDVGNFIGVFLDSDPNNFTGFWNSYLCIRVKLDVRKPLKRRMKVKMEGGEWSWINFKYERLPIFCFFCGLLGHSELFCEKFLEITDPNVEKPYGSFMRAPNKKPINRIGDKWLRFNSPERESGSSPGTTGGGDSGNINGGVAGMQVDEIGINAQESQKISNLANSTSGGISSRFCGIENNSSKQINTLLKQIPLIKENTQPNIPNSEGLIFTDPKRRRNEGNSNNNVISVLEGANPGAGQTG